MNTPDVIHLVINGQTVCGAVLCGNDDTHVLKGDALDRDLMRFFDEAHRGEHSFCEACVDAFISKEDTEPIQ